MLLFVLSLACRNKDTLTETGLVSGDSSPPEAVDNDNDGYDEDEDCDDFNNTVYPGAVEVPYNGVDDDCDESTLDDDLDQDGYGEAEDCDDANADISPEAVEACNGIDDDCDGEIDDAVGDLWYVDADEDGYGDPETGEQSCDGDEDTVADGTDCDDTDASAFPGGTEVCDEADDDCDGTVDEGVTTTFYVDADGDGSGSKDLTVEACDVPTGYDDDDEDCDDTDAAVSPNATEICDDVDNDCDGDIDGDAVDIETWYRDGDGDTYGDPDTSTEDCDQPSGYVSDDTDCDDTDADVNPGVTWYIDYDGDGYGSTAYTVDSCEQPSGYVADTSDCDDSNADINPDGDEVCNDEDDDCDSSVDEGDAGGDTWYADSDGDGYGDATDSEVACDQPSGYVDNDDDCDDTDADAYTGATEVCDGSDNDCDGTADNDETVLGAAEDCPADSCEDILDTRTSTPSDGDYWIDPAGSGAFEIFCDMTSEGGGWTLVANIDDVNDPWLLAQDDTWETTTLRNETTLPSYGTDITVTAKYESWTTLEANDVYVYYKNDSTYFLCEGLDVVDTLDAVFSTTASVGSCASQCTTWSQDQLSETTIDPVGLNCNDANEGWMSSSSYTAAENARIGGVSSDISCCVMNAWAGAAGDRGFSTSDYNKTWGAYYSGALEDDNILVFIR